MAGPGRDDGGVIFCRAPRAARWPGLLAAFPLSGMLLTGVLLTGCGSGAPAGGTGVSQPGTPGPGSAGPGSAAAAPRHTVGAGSHPMIEKRPPAPPSPSAAAGGPGSGPGCSRWPAGSTSTTLFLTQASTGRQYCVQPGQGVQVFLSGQLTPKEGAEPPRLTGTGLAPASGPRHLLRSPADAYQAVRAGRSVLIVVRTPCQSAPSPAAPDPDSGGAQGAGSLNGPGAPASPAAVELAYTGGAPVGTQCAPRQALRVTIVVP